MPGVRSLSLRSFMPPRVAFFLATSGHSGVDRLMGHLLPAVARRGYQVDLLRVRRHGPAIDDPAVRIVDLRTAHVYTALPALLRYLRREHPRVLLSDKDRVNRVALLARALSGVDTRQVLRSGTTVSRDLASRRPLDRWLQRASMSGLYRYAQSVIVPSRGAAADLARYTGLALGRITVVPNPVVSRALLDAASAPPPHPWFEPGQPPVILGVGELCARKDFETLLRAFARLRRERDCRLLILGEGRLRHRLEALGHTMGVADDLALPGFQPHPYPYLAHSALLASSSRWEGLGVALVEALALGTPVVSTDCPSGPREILKDGLYGPLVPVGDVEALADAIRRTLDKPPPRSLLKEAAAPYEVESATSAYLRAMGLAEFIDRDLGGRVNPVQSPSCPGAPP
jgi:glycosyltransferase involved in cell wall biosynthesis